MLQTLEEVRNASLGGPGAVINGVDSPNVLSIDSTTPLESKEADTPVKEEEQPKTKTEDKPVEGGEKKENEQEEVQEGEDDEDGKPKPPAKSKEARIDKLTKKWRSAEREAGYFKGELDKANAKIQELEGKIPATDKPKKEDFESEEDYTEALVVWTTKETLRKADEKVAKTASSEEERQAIDETYQTVDAMMEKGQEKYGAEFVEKTTDKDLTISQGMVETILLSDVAEDIMWYLADNPDVAADLAKMSDKMMTREITKIEATLGKEAEKSKPEEKPEEKEKPKVKKSNAPAPITPVRTSDGGVVDPEKMSMKEYRAWRESRK